MERELEIKTANAQAFYQSVLSNIRVANDVLSGKLEQIDNANALISESQLEAQRAQSILAPLQEQQYSLLVNIKNLERQLEEKIVATKAKREDVEDEFKDVRSALSRGIAIGEAKLSDIHTAIERAEKKLRDTADKVNHTILEEKLAQSRVDVLKVDHANLYDKYKALAGEVLDYERKAKSLRSDIEQLDLEMQSRNDSVSTFRANVRRAHEDLDKRARDMLILQMRLKRRFEEIGVATEFPIVEIPALPQEFN